MDDEQPRDKQQRQQQQDDHSLLRSERKARGVLRNTHLEAGREQARSDNERSRERNPTKPPHMEGTSDDDYEAKRNAQKEADRAAMKAEGRTRYEGSDEDFERDWPAIREQLITRGLEKNLRRIRRRL